MKVVADMINCLHGHSGWIFRLLVLFFVVFSNIGSTLTAVSEPLQADHKVKSQAIGEGKNISSSRVVTLEKCEDENDSIDSCPSEVACNRLGGDCLNCTFNCTCVYGSIVNVTCTPKQGVQCKGQREFQRSMTCRYCYQTHAWEHTCSGRGNCKAVSAPREMFKSNCSVRSDVLCLGKRSFPKNLPCNWTSGYKWSTALLLSITLGGFGADRFYLGHWREGIGKLFSFGGLGVWTIMDVILIAVRYLGPADGSLYI